MERTNETAAALAGRAAGPQTQGSPENLISRHAPIDLFKFKCCG